MKYGTGPSLKLQRGQSDRLTEFTLSGLSLDKIAPGPQKMGKHPLSCG